MQETSHYEARAMKPIQFDSLGYFNELKAADVPDAQAQAQAKALQKVLEDALAGHMADLATKGDLQATKNDLNNEIALVRSDLQAAKSDLSNEIVLVRKDLGAEIALVRKDMEAGFAKVDARIDAIQNTLVIRLSVIMASMFAFVELVHRVF